MKMLRLQTCILGVFIVLVYIGLAQAGSITFDDLKKNTKINGLDFDGDFFSGNRALLVYGKGSDHAFSAPGKNKSISAPGKNKFLSTKGKNDSFRLDFQDAITSIDFDMLAGKRKALDFEAKFYDEHGNLIGDVDDFMRRDKRGFWHFSFAADTPIAYMIFTDHNRKLDLGFDNFRFGRSTPLTPIPEPLTPVPEPSTVLLLGTGLGALGLYGRRLGRTRSQVQLHRI